MEQDYLITNEQPEQTPPEKEKKPKADPQLRILAVQVGICVAIIVFCLIAKTFFGSFFSEIKDWYNENVNADTTVSEILSTTSGSGGPVEQGLDASLPLEGGFVMPVSGTLSSSYGYRADPFTGEIAAHNGLDIAADLGSNIYAAVEGTVELASYTSGDYGNYIILNHGGFKTLYAHCQSLKVTKGQRVLAGQVIATCGSTGRSTGPHLHFEIRIGQKRIDPTPFLSYK